MNYNKKQQEQISYLKAALGADDATVTDCLKKSNWDSDRACDLYYSLPKKEAPKPGKASKKVEDTFAKYKEKDVD